MRPIDADALIAYLKKAGRFLKAIEGSKPFTKAIGKIIDQIEAMPTIEQPTWISVDERLPKGCDGKDCAETVIAYLKNGEKTEVCVGWMNGFWWWLIVGNDDEPTRWGEGAVTHWMPLPQPPKGVE